jgi:hypothetical protein
MLTSEEVTSEDESASKYPLLWMIEEAAQHGLAFNKCGYQSTGGAPSAKAAIFICSVDYKRDLHQSLQAWRPRMATEVIATKNGRRRKTVFGYFIPAAEPRSVPEGAGYTEDICRRNYGPGYKPANFQIPIRPWACLSAS